MGIYLTPGRAACATAIAVAAAALVIAVADSPAYVAVIVGLLAASLAIVTVGGATAEQWIRRAGKVSSPLTPQRVVVRDGAATLHYGQEVSAWLEVSTPESFSTTVVDVDGTVDRPELTPESLQRLLVQDDIALTSMEFITISQRSVGRGRASAAMSQAAGKVSWPVDGRSFIKISFDRTRSHAAVAARAPGDDLDTGAAKAIVAAAARIRIKCEALGYSARILSPEQVERVSAEALALSEGSPSWSAITTETHRTEFYSAPVSSSRAADWLSLPVTRVYTSMSVTLTSGDRPQVAQIVGLVTAASASVRDQIRGLPLKPLGGQQQQALSRLVPLAGDMELSVPGSSPADASYTYAGGVGVLVGHLPGGDRLFLRPHPGTGQTMHCIGSTAMCQWLVQRLAQHAMSIDVRVHDESWQRLVAEAGSPLLTYRSNDTADIVIAPASVARAGVVSSQTVIGVADTPPPLPAPVSLVQSGAGELTLTTPDGQWAMPWSMTASEKRALHLGE